MPLGIKCILITARRRKTLNSTRYVTRQRGGRRSAETRRFGIDSTSFGASTARHERPTVGDVTASHRPSHS